MEAVFKALADATRRTLLDRLRQADGLTLGQLCDGVALTRQAVSRHLAQLESANLIATTWRGREKIHHLNPVPIGQIYSRWIGRFDEARVSALINLKYALEEKAMALEAEAVETFVYSIFIDSTQEKIWKALTDGEFTRQYWAGRRIISDWAVGSDVYLYSGTSDEYEVRGEVLEYDPFSRLSYSWTSSGHAEAGSSTVAFDLMMVGGSVQLKVTHAPLPAASMARNGWAAILSSLKSFLETGQPLAATALFRKGA